MAHASDHIDLANKCNTTLHYLLLRYQDHPEWIAIVAFYKAVHVVEAMFAHKRGAHSCDHNERVSMLQRFHGNVLRHFRVLLSKSLLARYLSDRSSGGAVCAFTDDISAEQVVRELVGRRLVAVESICMQEMADSSLTAALQTINPAQLPVL